MQSDIRNNDSGIQRGKAHSALVETEGTHNIKAKLDQQPEILQQVVQGLAQVAELVSTKNVSREWNNEKQRRNDPPKWRCGYHSVDSRDIGKCTRFSHLEHGEKIDLLRKNRGCFSCLKQGHLSRNCVNRKPCEIQGCQRTHHPTIHSVSRAGDSLHSNTWIVNGENIRGSERTLLMVSSVDSKQGKLTTLWDPGANMSLITHRAAHRLGLVGKDVTLTLTKVGNSCETVCSKEYVVPLYDKSGNKRKVRACGIEEVTANLGFANVDHTASLFPGITKEYIRRPTGKVDMLIGTDCCILLPDKVQEVEVLKLMKNQFGYCLRGKHESLGASSVHTGRSVRTHFTSGLKSDINVSLKLADHQSKEI